MMNYAKYVKIYKAYCRLSMKIAYDIIRDKDLAEDICQEVFIKLYQNFDDADENLIKAWIVLNTKRKAIDYYRKLVSNREVCAVEENLVVKTSTYGIPEDCLDQMNRAELSRLVFQRLKEKNPMWYDLLVRVAVEKENPETVAKEYGITVMNMRTKIHRARVWIREEFGADYEDLK
ncbi:MAG: RNA polymerase sigma factor [Blautia sp.]|jgi:RNA polymerase sigma factor (sigma-70 family)